MKSADTNSVSQADRLMAALIAVACVAMVVAIAHHPVAQGATVNARIVNVAQQGATDELVHGAIYILLLTLACGMSHYSLRRGINKPAVLAAGLAYCLATALSFVAMAYDGFVIPALARRCADGSSDCLNRAGELLSFASLCVQVFSRIGLLLMALSTILWSVDLLTSRKARVRGVVCGGISAAQLWLLSGVAYVLTPHSLLAVMATQIVWYLLVAASLGLWPIERHS